MPSEKTPPSLDDAGADGESVALLSRFARGDDSALGRLVEEEAPWLLARMRKRLPAHLQQRVGASDIVQATAIDLIAVRDRFENRGVHAFRKMLARIADLNLAKVLEREHAQKRDAARDRRGLQLGAAESARLFTMIAAEQTTPSEVMMRAERVQLLEQCYRFLSQPDQQILRCVDFDGMEYSAVAQQLGVGVDTARRRHSRAVQRLRRLVERANAKKVSASGQSVGEQDEENRKGTESC